MSAVRVLGIDADRYQSHSLHRADMPWQETNCYLDVWIELIHAFGFDVHPCLGFALGVDFEGDQWTFFKPSFHNLQRLYGFRTEELALWRSLPDQCAVQVANGSLPLLEVDSFYLPDTAATDYQKKHVKTSIGINEIDQEGRSLGYFHNTGYHVLSGSDYDGIFRLDRADPEDYLSPYCEIVKTHSLLESSPSRGIVLEILAEQFAARPEVNPFDRYADALDEHLSWITDMETYHAYVFATLRQCGAAFDMAARHLQWIGEPEPGATAGTLSAAATEFSTISAICKTLLLKLARVASGKTPSGLTALVSDMSAAWNKGMELTGTALASDR